MRGLSTRELSVIDPLVKERSLAAGETLVRQGEPATELYIVRSGRLEIVKTDEGDEREHVIGEVRAREVVGEVALFNEQPRFATVRATRDCVLCGITFNQLRPSADQLARSSLDPRPKPVQRAYRKLLENLAKILADRLRAQADVSLADAKRRHAVARFLINILVLVCLYSFLLSGLDHIERYLPDSTSYVSIPMQVLFAFGSWRFIRSTGYPLADFGITHRQAVASTVEALVLTVPVLAILTGVKWLILWLRGSLGEVSLIAYPDVAARLSEPQVSRLFAVYVVSCAVQELIVRGALQSSLEMFLTGPRRVLQAVLVSALLFSMTHLHMSFLFAALAFIPGLFWGWLFARRRNLAGVTLSHIAVGAYVFFIMGVAL
ncbi:MAG: cyclic nucleotide-binding domain-containing protein [Deltaproteobacteria bacterium]|nr:cyclic nucleotide-binding domain-containing protein [Deltaproteobacteria bacterium]